MISGTAVVTLVSFCMLWYLFYFAYRDYRMDLLRHRLFNIRTDLFLLANDGRGIAFDHPAHRHFRDTVNSYIRFAPHLNLVTILLFLITKGYRGPEPARLAAFSDRFDEATSDLPLKTRQDIGKLRGRMDKVIAEHVLMTSGLMWVLLIPIIVFAFAIHHRNRLTRWWRREWRSQIGPEIEGAALAYDG